MWKMMNLSTIYYLYFIYKTLKKYFIGQYSFLFTYLNILNIRSIYKKSLKLTGKIKLQMEEWK